MFFHPFIRFIDIYLRQLIYFLSCLIILSHHDRLQDHCMSTHRSRASFLCTRHGFKFEVAKLAVNRYLGPLKEISRKDVSKNFMLHI